VADTERPFPADTAGPMMAGIDQAVVVGGQAGEEELIAKFKADELKYPECPTFPKETRRLFFVFRQYIY
jgi:hypothetical protein